MPTAIRLIVNCVGVAAVTVAGLFAFVSLPAFTLEPLQWADQQFGRSFALTFWFVYTVLVWAAIAGVVALCMLMLRPKNVILYGLASAVAFIVFGESWTLGSAYAYSRELILALTIPALYWAFVHMAGKRHNKALNTDAGDAGAS